MGQTFSDFFLSFRALPTPSEQPTLPGQPLTPPEQNVPLPEQPVTPPEQPVTPPEQNVPLPEQPVTPPEQPLTPHAPPTPPTPVPVHRPPNDPSQAQKIEDNVRKFILANQCCETFNDASYHEGERIKELITNYLPYLDITRVCVVKNDFLLGMYQMKKAEYKSRYGSRAVKELTMFHATDENNVQSIIKDNLDWRRVYRTKYGVGVSFSEDPDYCNFHCTRNNGSRRVYIVADVLVCRQTYGDCDMVVPPDSYDTAVGNNNLVYVKFHDNEFLPKYLVFYDAPSRQMSKYWVRRW